MASFQAGSHTWQVRLTYGLLTRIKAEFNLNIATAVMDADRFVEVLYSDPMTLAGVVWVLCESQAQRAGVSPEAFGQMIDGDALDAAMKAIFEASVDFFPKARGRDAIRKNLPRAIEKIEKDTNAAIEKRSSTLWDNA